ncbi:MAG: helix-turn-helix transcriptional regulator [Acidimicrobiales bacterium]
MGRLDRLERVTNLLLVLLDTPRPLSLREIADRVPGYPDTHGARRQAFERDKRLLRDEGVPVLVAPLDGHDQLGYRVDPDEYFLPDLGLDTDEQSALNLAVAGVHLGEPIGRDALSKLGAIGERPSFGTRSMPVVALPSVRELPALPVLFDALRASATVSFDYRGDERHVDVAAIRFRRGHWYMVGFDRDRGEPRTFRVDRFESVPEVGRPMSGGLSDGLDPADAFSLDPWQFGSGEETEVEVLIDAADSGRVLTELGEEAVSERRKDGSVVVRLAVTDRPAFLTWVLGWLDHAEVLAPAEMRAAVVERLASMVTADGPATS